MVQLHPIATVATDPDRNFGNVVFVHGLTGHPYTTWGGVSASNEGETFWPRQLAKERGLDRLAFYTLEYAAPRTKWKLWGRRWNGEAEPLLRRDRTVLDELLKEEALRSAPTAFICHSLGGLVIKATILLESDEQETNPAVKELFASVAQVMFLGTPHFGSGLASFVNSLPGYQADISTNELKKNEAGLKRLNERYIGLVRRFRKRIDHLVFRETEKTGGAFGVIVVPLDSANPGITGVEPIDVPGADHNDLCTPPNPKALVYERTLDLLRKLPDAEPYFEAGWSTDFDDFTAHYTQGPVPFGGRDDELKQLDQWLADESAEPSLLLSAPAGMGKSAVLVRWVEQLKKSMRIVGPSEVPQPGHEDAWRLVFVPISKRFESSRPQIYLGALARQLAAFAHATAPDPQASDTHYRDLCHNLLGQLAQAGKRILLVIDGLDEASEEETLRNILPWPLPACLKVLVSARWQGEEKDNTGWLDRLGWSARTRPDGHDLVVGPLNEKAIGEALVGMGGPMRRLGRNPAFVARLREVTEGEPLLLRLFAEDLWALEQSRKSVSLATLAEDKPGFAAYFNKWLDRYRGAIATGGRRRSDADTIDPAIAIMGFAEGPLSGEEFQEVASAGFPKLGWESEARSHVEPFQRFLISSKGRPVPPYDFIHPKLREHIRASYCSAELAEAAIAAFVTRGRGHVQHLNNGGRFSPYVLQHYTGYLDTARKHYPRVGVTTDDYLARVADGWRRARERFDSGPGGFARDVEAAWAACRRDGDLAHLGAQWRCALTLSSIKSLGRNIAGPLLVELVRDGILSARQGQHYSTAIEVTDEAVLALVGIAHVIYANPRAAAQMANAAVDRAINSDGADWYRVRAIAKALDALHFLVTDNSISVPDFQLDRPKIERALADALRVARSIPEHYLRGPALASLIPHLDSVKRDEVVATTLKEAKNGEISGSLVLIEVGPHLDAKQSVAALEIAQTYYPAGPRCQMLAAVAPRLDLSLRNWALDSALNLLMGTPRDQQWFRTVTAIAPHLDIVQGTEVLNAAFLEAKMSRDETYRSEAFAALTPLLDHEQRAYVLHDVQGYAKEDNQFIVLMAFSSRLYNSEGTTVLHMAKAWRSNSYYKCALVIAALAQQLNTAELAEALDAALAIGSAKHRSFALAGLAPRLDLVQRAVALRASMLIGDDQTRYHVLALLAPHLHSAQRRKAVEDALQAEKTIEVLAPYLDPVQLVKALDSAIAMREPFRSDTLSALAPRLNVAQRAYALKKAQALGDNVHLSVLTVLVQYLDRTQCEEALKAVVLIHDTSILCQALEVLASHLDEELRIAVVAHALERVDNDLPDYLASVAALAPHLDAAQQADVLRTLKTHRLSRTWAGRVVGALRALAPHLDEGLRNGVVTSVHEMAQYHSSEYLSWLMALAPHLNAEQSADVLVAVKSIRHSDDKTRLLVALAAHLDHEQRTNVLRHVMSVRDECRKLLTALAPHLDADQRAEAIQIAMEFSRQANTVSFSSALKALAPHLDAGQRTDTLLQVKAMADENERSHAVATLASHLSGAQCAEAFEEATALRDESVRATRLAAWVPYLDPDKHDAVFEAAKEIRDDQLRFNLLAKLVEFKSDINPKALMVEMLEAVSKLPRFQFVENTKPLINLTVLLGGPSAVEEVRTAIADICSWYP